MEPRENICKRQNNENATVTVRHCYTNSCLLCFSSVVCLRQSLPLSVATREEADELQKKKNMPKKAFGKVDVQGSVVV